MFSQLHVHTTLRRIDDEHTQSYIFMLMPFEDRTIPALDNIVRNIIVLLFHTKHVGSESNDESSMGKVAEKKDQKKRLDGCDV